MPNFNINKEFNEFKNAYSCAKCGGNKEKIVSLACKHFVCVICVAKMPKSCPKCSKKFDTIKNSLILDKVQSAIQFIEDLFPNGNYLIEDINLEPSNEETHFKDLVTVEGINGTIKILKGVQPKRNPKGETPLHHACSKNNILLLRKLLNEPIDINCTDWSNCTPLSEAVSKNHLECVKILLENGALPAVPLQFYQTPLHRAIQLGFLDVAALLIQYGAPLDALDAERKTPLDYCKDAKSLKIIQEMDINHINKELLIFNCDSSNEMSKTLEHCASALLEPVKVINGIQILVIDSLNDSTNELSRPQVLACLLKAIPIVFRKDIPQYIKGNPLDTKFIPAKILPTFTKSLENRLRKLPRLFHGMNFHLCRTKKNTYHCLENNYTKEELQGLIEIAGGQILRRAPCENTVMGFPMAYHTQNHSVLSECSNFIVFDEHDAPLLQYRMADLRHVSATWLIKCIISFSIVDLNK